MSGDLRVTTAHLRELAAKQRQAATEIGTATGVTRGVDLSVRLSHGVIAWSTADAVASAQQARATAGEAMERASDELGANLVGAAGRYDSSDGTAAHDLDGRVRPRSA
jgi:hypothetical protein